MHNINDNAVQSRLSKNHLRRKIIAWNIIDTKIRDLRYKEVKSRDVLV